MNPPPVHVALMLGLSVALPANAEPSSENEGRIQAYLERFPDADSDKDGVLTLTELKNHYTKSRNQKKSRGQTKTAD